MPTHRGQRKRRRKQRQKKRDKKKKKMLSGAEMKIIIDNITKNKRPKNPSPTVKKILRILK